MNDEPEMKKDAVEAASEGLDKAGLLEKVFSSALNGIFVIDRNARYVEANPAGCEMFGYTRDELLASDVRLLLFPEDYERCVQAQAEVFRGDTRRVTKECRMRRKDGSGIWVELVVNLFTVDEAPYALCIKRDLTERKRMEAELLKAQKLDSIGVLAGGLAHDFNNLLHGILGNVSIAKSLLTPGDKACDILDRVEKAAQRSKELTKKLLTFSKGGAPVMESVPIDALVRDSANLLLRETGIECKFAFPEDLPLVEMDEGQITQVINNVILNAHHAMPDGGVVEFVARKVSVSAKDGLPLTDGGYVELSIKDHGTGMTPKVLHHMFDPFFTTKRKASGLGLSVSYSIVKKHHGFIYAESSVGEGTTVHIYLPAVPSAPVVASAPIPAVHGEVMTGKGRVLVMDDEDMIRDVSKEMLEFLGYEAECAAEGREAIALFSKAREEGRPFDAVMLDLTVSNGMGGVETLARLLDIDPDVKAIVSSGYSRETIMSEYRKHGFKGIIAKPYRVPEFSRVVREVIG